MERKNSAIVDGDHEDHAPNQAAGLTRKDSQTATEWVNSQLQLEAEAREALPYSFDNCTQPLGSIRQNVFACLTCHPPPESPDEPYTPAGLCYGCQIACHGEHTLVEIFARRNFTCDCGTTRFGTDAPCTLRTNPETGLRGSVHSQPPAEGNDYNKNFRNRFCGCNEWYDAEKQRGTMYQCLGLASEKDGGCGEDWWHPECLLGLPRDWYVNKKSEANGMKKESAGKDVKKEDSTEEGVKKEESDEAAHYVVSANINGAEAAAHEEEEHPVPQGFPQDDDDFEALICYKCVAATSWLRDYADSKGFMTLSYKTSAAAPHHTGLSNGAAAPNLKRSFTDDGEREGTPSKKTKVEDEAEESKDAVKVKVKPEPDTDEPLHTQLPPAPLGTYSILPTEEGFRERFCRCAECYPRLAACRPLLEEEEIYQPPLSEDGDGAGDGAGSAGTASLLDRGEAALSNMDRVKAIEGVMVYNHLKDKVKTFLAPFAESGQAVGAEDIKAYFEKLRGDAEAIKAAGSQAAQRSGGDNEEGDGRKGQSGK